MPAVLQLTDAAGPSFLERLNAVEEELNCGPAYSSLSVNICSPQFGRAGTVASCRWDYARHQALEIIFAVWQNDGRKKLLRSEGGGGS